MNIPMTCYNCKDETEKETPVFELMKYLKDSDGWYKQRCPQCLITAKEEWLKDINNDKKHILIMFLAVGIKYDINFLDIGRLKNIWEDGDIDGELEDISFDLEDFAKKIGKGVYQLEFSFDYVKTSYEYNEYDVILNLFSFRKVYTI